ncbi:MAG: EAL domain-containing protein, partial [Pseudomonadota bacterium]|nr:EAL domain-containing protein [Pseudomonadota bacterium]
GFFCNISDATMRDVAFFQDFVGFLAANPSLKNSLIFEFSQAVVDSNDLETRINLQRLTQLGFRLSLDRVSHLDFDGADLAGQRFGFIKVNAHMLHEYADHNSVANLRGNLSRHGIDLIVEKIESEDMLADLRQLGITYGQGFLFGEPRAARIQNDR